MFDILMRQIQKRIAQFDWNLANCDSPHRLRQLLHDLDQSIVDFECDADDLVMEEENAG